MLFQELSLQQSRILGAIFCLFFTSFITLIKIIITVAILANLIMVNRAYALRCNDQAIIGFWQNDNGEWYLQTKTNELIPVLLGFPIFISSYFIILNFVLVQDTRKISVPLAKDAFMVKDNFRRLKVLLRTNRIQ